MKSPQYVYLIHLREFIRMNENVFKIGKTTQENGNRFGQYSKGWKLLLQISCENCHEIEKTIKKLFREKYIKRNDFGSEYFEGDYREMIRDICKIVNKKEKIDCQKDVGFYCENCQGSGRAYLSDGIYEKCIQCNGKEHEYFPTVLDQDLINAAEDGDLKMVKYLVGKGADIEARDNEALVKACNNGHLEIVKYLVEKGANVKAKDNWSLISASENGYLEVVKFLVENGTDIENGNPIINASMEGHFEVVRYLVEKGADIHADNDEAVICASENGHLEVVKYLVEQGADIHVKYDRALYCAKGENRKDVIQYLESLKLESK